MSTHYGVIVFGGDADNDHPDEALRGHGPEMTLLASGDANHCWHALTEWTATHPLRRDETVEVLARVQMKEEPQ